MQDYSELQLARARASPVLPGAFSGPAPPVVAAGEETAPLSPSARAAFASWLPSTLGQRLLRVVPASDAAAPAARPLRVGVVFCGRQCPGGHNVVAGLYDALKRMHSGSVVLGFVRGTAGLFSRDTIELTSELIAPFRNQGGYDLLGRSVDRLRLPSEQAAALATATALSLDGLVLLGGTITNTDAAHLAEFFSGAGCATRVIGVPCTIDGDMRRPLVETSLGFDTVSKITAALVGNLETDCNSAKKYVYFARVLGREGGHMALEVGLQTNPNLVLLGEDISARKMTLADVVGRITDVIAARAAAGKQFAVIIVPEGLLMHVPELRALVSELNILVERLAEGGKAPPATAEEAAPSLSPWSRALLLHLPPTVRAQLFLERESSGALQLSQIATEKLLIELVGEEITRRRAAGGAAACAAKGGNCMGFFVGYQARSALPTAFDCALGLALGHTAAALVASGATGYLAAVSNLSAPTVEWHPVGVPLAALLAAPAPGSSTAMGARAPQGGPARVGLRPSILPAPVDIASPAFRALHAAGAASAAGECYRNPGPIQYEGPTADDIALTLHLETRDYLSKIADVDALMARAAAATRPGCDPRVLDAVHAGLAAVSAAADLGVKRGPWAGSGTSSA